jgi:MFS family permease
MLSPDSQVTAGRQWAIFGVVSTALLMSSIDGTIVATVLPTLRQVMDTSLSLAGWTLTVYSMGQIVAAPLAGRIADQYGRRRLFLVALTIFTTSSLLCGLTTSVAELIALRLIQALGGGAILPTAIGVISDTFGARKGRPIGLTSSFLSAGGLIGPVLGAVMVSALSWRWVFFVNVPIGVVTAVLGAWLIPRSRPPATGRGIDTAGLGLLIAAIASFMLASTMLASGQGTLAWVLAALAIAVTIGSGYGLAVHSARVPAPLIPMRFVAGTGFRLVNLVNLGFGASVLGLATLWPTYATDRYHLSVLASGALLTARAIGSILIAAVTSFALERTGFRLPIMVGMAAIAIGFLLTALPPPGIPVLAWLTTSTVLTGIGFGLSAPAANNAALSLAPEAVGVITGLRGVLRQTGSIAAVSIATTVASRSADPRLALAVVFAVAAALLVLCLPAVRHIQEDTPGRGQVGH